jgi:hypothetical protein
VSRRPIAIAVIVAGALLVVLFGASAFFSPYGDGWWSGFGPTMTSGFGPFPVTLGTPFGQRDLNLSADDVKNHFDRALGWQGNPHVKLGMVQATDADHFSVDIVTQDNSLADRLLVDRHTGFISRAQG